MKENDVIAVPSELAGKVRLIRIGVYCFVSCLGGSAILIALSVTFEIINGPVLGKLSSFLMTSSIILFVGLFASFGLIMSGALKHPRGSDPRPYLSSAISGAALIFVVVSAVFALILFTALAYVIVTAYRQTGETLFLSLVYFILSGAFFALTVCIVIARNIVVYQWILSPFRGLASRLSAGMKNMNDAMENTRGKKLLTKVDTILGSLIGIVFGLIIEGTDLSGTGKTSESPIPMSGLMITGATIFVCIFATIMIVRGIRALIDLK